MAKQATPQTVSFKGIPNKFLLNKYQNNFVQKNSIIKVPVKTKETGEIFHKHFIIDSSLEKWTPENPNPLKALSNLKDGAFDLTLLAEKQQAIEIDSKNKMTFFSQEGELLKKQMELFLSKNKRIKDNKMFGDFKFTSMNEKEYEKNGKSEKMLFINNIPRECNLGTVSFPTKNGEEMIFNVIRFYENDMNNRTNKLFLMVHSSNLKNATFVDKQTGDKKISSNFNLSFSPNTHINLLQTKSFALNTLVEKAYQEKLFTETYNEKDLINDLKINVVDKLQGIPANVKFDEPSIEVEQTNSIYDVDEIFDLEEEVITPILNAPKKKFTL